MKVKIIAWLLIANFCSSCATSSNRSKQLATTIAGFGVGFGAGVALAPADESKPMHGLLIGAVVAAAAGATSLFIFDSEKKIKSAEQNIAKLNSELEEYRSNAEPKLVDASMNSMGKELPDSISGLIRPGGWKLFKTDRWIEEGDNQLIHQDKILQFTPASLNPKTSSLNVSN